MRSFLGRDILSLRDFEREEYFQVFRVADALAPAARDRRNGDLLRDKGKTDAIVLHSLPRMDELPTEVDATRPARYWVEAFNGVVVRMALLALVLGAVE